MKNNVFNNLGDFGLDELKDVSIYSHEKKNAEKHHKAAVHNPVEHMIFERTIECPVCKGSFKAKAVKSSSVRMISKDTDFMIRYKDPNPTLYDVWLCTNCGYAALSSKFNTLSDKQANEVREKISKKWSYKKVQPSIYTEDVSIELHQLALLNAIVKNARDSEKAILCLKTAWLYRLKEDEDNEKRFLSEAINGFNSAMEKEYFPISGMDSPTLSYLIGELYRRTGDNSKALFWYGKTLIDRTAKQNIKDLARDQKDLLLK
jgi:uncharacterized protein (DUF2225 family)